MRGWPNASGWILLNGGVYEPKPGSDDIISSQDSVMLNLKMEYVREDSTRKLGLSSGSILELLRNNTGHSAKRSVRSAFAGIEALLAGLPTKPLLEAVFANYTKSYFIVFQDMIRQHKINCVV